jgi:hypothetical protein
LSENRWSLGWSYSSIPGVIAFEATDKEFPMPVGVLWFRFLHRSTIIEILGCYVPVYYRRKGILTFLHEQLLSSYPKVVKIITEDGSKDGGKAWLTAMGYRRNGPIYEYCRVVAKKKGR